MFAGPRGNVALLSSDSGPRFRGEKSAGISHEGEERGIEYAAFEMREGWSMFSEC